jgi:carboxyl-terminal processing protease
MSTRTRLVVLLVSTPIVAFAVVGGLLGKTVTREDTYQHLRVFEDVVSLIANNYVEDVEMDRVMEGAMRGLAEGLDPDTSYLSAADVAALEGPEAAPAGEVGLELTRQYYLRVVAARDGSPAAKAGLRTGDYVRAIDGEPTRRMSLFEGRRRLRGPVGSKVTLTVLRDSATEPKDIVLVRERSSAEPVTVRQVAPGVGLIRVASFEGEAVDAIRKGVDTLREGGATSLVIDLRSTAWGPLERGLDAARLFLPAGTLVQRQARGQAAESIESRPGDGTLPLPLVVLVTTGTSGAAELFASALSENKRAELVGERTLGRAGQQKLVKLSDGTGLFLTTTRYLTAAGKPIHGAGVEPTERVEEPDVELGDTPPAGDPILDKALGRLAAKPVKAAA